MDDVKEYIKNIKKKITEQEGTSAPGNVTSNVDGYNIPAAFSKDEEEHEKRMNIVAPVLGYTIVKKQTPKNFIPVHNKPLKKSKNESVYSELASELYLNEMRYKDFKNDETYTNSKKMNLGIKRINRTLYELESIINQHSKLKNEMSITNEQYWKSSKHRLKKIAERMIRISKQIIEIAS